MKTLQMQNKYIEFILGDITKIQADAIVNSANKFLKSGCGVCGAIFEASGQGLNTECAQIISKLGRDLNTSEAVCTKAYMLPAKYIIHVVSPRCMMRWSEKIQNGYKDAYNAVFDLANTLQLGSIAMPALGTRAVHCCPNNTSSVAMDTIFTYLSSCESSLNNIKLVFAKQDILDIYFQKLASKI